MHKIFCHAVPMVPCSACHILQTAKDGVYIGCMGGPYGRGRQNFCLQKSRMPLAGLLYFLCNLAKKGFIGSVPDDFTLKIIFV